MSLAKDIIELTEIWNNTDKTIIVNKIEKIMEYYLMTNSRSKLIAELAKNTNVSIHTAAAWLNRSRKNVKIPLIKLCMLSDHLGIDIKDMLIK